MFQTTNQYMPLLLPSGKRLHNYGKSPLFRGKSYAISMVISIYQRVNHRKKNMRKSFADINTHTHVYIYIIYIMHNYIYCRYVYIYISYISTYMPLNRGKKSHHFHLLQVHPQGTKDSARYSPFDSSGATVAAEVGRGTTQRLGT